MIKGLSIFVSFLGICYNFYYATVSGNKFVNEQSITDLANMVYYLGVGIIFALLQIGFINLSSKEPTNVKKETLTVE